MRYIIATLAAVLLALAASSDPGTTELRIDTDIDNDEYCGSVGNYSTCYFVFDGDNTGSSVTFEVTAPVADFCMYGDADGDGYGTSISEVTIYRILEGGTLIEQSWIPNTTAAVLTATERDCFVGVRGFYWLDVTADPMGDPSPGPAEDAVIEIRGRQG